MDSNNVMGLTPTGAFGSMLIVAGCAVAIVFAGGSDGDERYVLAGVGLLIAAFGFWAVLHAGVSWVMLGRAVRQHPGAWVYLLAMCCAFPVVAIALAH